MEQDTAKMVHNIEERDSDFFKKFPMAKITYWFTIKSAEETVRNPSKKLLIPFQIRYCRFELRSLNHERQKGLYKNYTFCSELEEIEIALEDVLKKLMEKANQLDIPLNDDLFQ